MIKIISWNTNKKKTAFIQNALIELALEQEPEIFVFQECLGQYVNTILDPHYEEIPYPGNGINRRVRVFLKQNTFIKYAIKDESLLVDDFSDHLPLKITLNIH